jgi:hypothetical protein
MVSKFKVKILNREKIIIILFCLISSFSANVCTRINFQFLFSYFFVVFELSEG